jgi:hypothetical protein
MFTGSDFSPPKAIDFGLGHPVQQRAPPLVPYGLGGSSTPRQSGWVDQETGKFIDDALVAIFGVRFSTTGVAGTGCGHGCTPYYFYVQMTTVSDHFVLYAFHFLHLPLFSPPF